MPDKLEIGVVFYRCAALAHGDDNILFSYLKECAAKVKPWDSERAIDPLRAAKDKKLGIKGFHSIFGADNILMSVIPRSATFLARMELQKDKSFERRLKVLTEVADKLFVLLRGRFGYADLYGDPPPGLSESVTTLSIRWLFWRNYYGLEYLEKWQRAYFERCKFHAVHELASIALRCDVRELPDEPMAAEAREKLEEHFADAGECEIYDAKRFPADF
jgi:hypothetical protein